MNTTEIERKYLVRSIPDDLPVRRTVEMRQGYVVVDSARYLSVRIRQEDDEYRLTLKQGRGLTRTEVELPLSSAQFEALWPATLGSLQKQRWLIGIDDSTIELDVFSGSLEGLVMAEVEFTSEADASAFNPPAWFGREVTDDARFLNQNLALNGLPAELQA
jgi:adenylate cyclase